MTGYKKPPLRRTPEIHLTPRNAKLAPLAKMYRSGKSWDAIGKEIGLPGMTVYRAVVKGEIPKSMRQRRALGIVVPKDLLDWPAQELAHFFRQIQGKNS